MNIVILLLSVIAVVLIIILFRKNRKTVSHKDKERFHKPPGKSNKNEPEGIVQKQTSSNDSPLKRIPSESHPDLNEINYFIPAEDTFPTTLQDLDEKTRKIIEKKISVLPPMPTTSIKLLSLLRNPESNPNKVTALVSTNPVQSQLPIP